MRHDMDHIIKYFYFVYFRTELVEQPQGCFKVPAGWLIEQLGLKGLRYGAAGIHAQQALVLVNYQNGKKDDCARDILALARYIQEKVLATFFIQLEIEPRIYGSV